MAEELVKESHEQEGNSIESPFGVSAQPEQMPVVEQEKKEGEKTEGKYTELLNKVSAVAPQSTATDEEIAHDAKTLGTETDEESKVQKLLDLASTKGVVHAVKVARSLKDYYALDKMHDALADSLYEKLLEKGLIEKE